MQKTECSLLDTLATRLVTFMPKFEFELFKIGPAFVTSALTFVSTIFLGGMIWAQLTGAQEQLRKDVDRVHHEMNLLRAYDTSIAVLRNDVVHVRESVNRIEQRIMKLGN